VTARYNGDCCPACGSDDLLPFAFIAGGLELYGYQCPCGRIWLVMHSEATEDTLALLSIDRPGGI
jgi:hypothetical protein